MQLLLRRSSRDHRRHWVLAAAISILSAGCASDGGGYLVLGLNEWDRDVIVAVTSGQPESLLLPARTWDTLFVSWSDPTGELKVFDASCRPMASLPFSRSGVTVRIGPAGEVELIGTEWRAPAGVGRPPTGPDEGPSFAVARCP